MKPKHPQYPKNPRREFLLAAGGIAAGIALESAVTVAAAAETAAATTVAATNMPAAKATVLSMLEAIHGVVGTATVQPDGSAAFRVPANASLLADFADAHVMSNGRQWDAQAKAAIGKALAADPKHLKALALAGSEAFDRKDFKAAVAFWERIIAAAAADSIEARAAQANIVEAKALIDGKPATAPASASAPAPTPAR